MSTVKVDFSKKAGRIKPLHGVGGGPISGNFTFDTTEYFKAAGIPFSRTHDIEYPYGGGEFVDVHCVFPNFDADVDDPLAYNFIFTDEYMKAIQNAGAQVFYRLGSAIEHQPIKRHTLPPKDYRKWAQICEHIILHYNAGWANGFAMNIRFWEIWNEPDLDERCWAGTFEEFYELYEVAATYLKKKFPDLSIGGCGFCGPQSPMVEGFFQYITRDGRRAPLDFFSWHGYIHLPRQAAALSRQASDVLERYGYTDALSIYDEWNYVVSWDETIQKSIDVHKTAKDAAFTAGVLAELQASRTDIAMYYDTQLNMEHWNGFFTALPVNRHGEKRRVRAEKPYYTFAAFNELYKLGTAVRAESDDSDIYVCAATDGKSSCILLSCYNDDVPFSNATFQRSVTVEITGAKYQTSEVFLLDRNRELERISAGLESLCMSSDSVVLIKLS